MLTCRGVYGTRFHVEPVGGHNVRISATAATGPAIVDSQLEVAERAGTLGHQTDGTLRLVVQRLIHCRFLRPAAAGVEGWSPAGFHSLNSPGVALDVTTVALLAIASTMYSNGIT